MGLVSLVTAAVMWAGLGALVVLVLDAVVAQWSQTHIVGASVTGLGGGTTALRWTYSILGALALLAPGIMYMEHRVPPRSVVLQA